MSYRIEYLTETTEENSVCHAMVSTHTSLEEVEKEALSHAQDAKARGATGFQIRHLNAVDRVVSIADFADFNPH